MERTLAILKPDCVRKNLVGKVLAHLQEAGFKIVAMKMVHLNAKTAGEFYAVHKQRPFFNDLVKFMTSGPCVPLVLEKENAKKPKGETLTIRILPEELALYQHYVDLTEYKNISDLVRKAVREKIEKMHIPSNPVEQRFLGTWGIHRKIGKAIEKHVLEVENEIEKIAETIDVSAIDDELLIDFIQKQQVSSAIAISLLRKKISNE